MIQLSKVSNSEMILNQKWSLYVTTFRKNVVLIPTRWCIILTRNHFGPSDIWIQLTQTETSGSKIAQNYFQKLYGYCSEVL